MPMVPYCTHQRQCFHSLHINANGSIVYTSTPMVPYCTHQRQWFHIVHIHAKAFFNVSNCQSWLFITVRGQFKSNRSGLYCQVTIWHRKHKRKTFSQAFTRSMQIYRIGWSLKFCGTVHGSILYIGTPMVRYCTHQRKGLHFNVSIFYISTPEILFSCLNSLPPPCIALENRQHHVVLSNVLFVYWMKPRANNYLLILLFQSAW